MKDFLEKSSFVSSLPKFSIKVLIIRLIISLTVFFLSYLIIRSIVETHFISLYTVSAIGKYLVLSWIFYPIAILISIFCFYPNKKILLQHFTSLTLIKVVYHTTILVLISFAVSLVLNVIYFINSDKSTAISLLSSYKGIGHFLSFNIFFFIQWVLVGLGEEIIFRGGFYRGIRSILPMGYSIILLSIFFLLMHSIHFYSSIFIFVSSAISAYYLEKQNNLVPIILLHILQDMYTAGITLYLGAYITSLL
jgi:membrane protease YdiL (CAAX protease family)